MNWCFYWLFQLDEFVLLLAVLARCNNAYSAYSGCLKLDEFLVLMVIPVSVRWNDAPIGHFLANYDSSLRYKKCKKLCLKTNAEFCYEYKCHLSLKNARQLVTKKLLYFQKIRLFFIYLKVKTMLLKITLTNVIRRMPVQKLSKLQNLPSISFICKNFD